MRFIKHLTNSVIKQEKDDWNYFICVSYAKFWNFLFLVVYTTVMAPWKYTINVI